MNENQFLVKSMHIERVGPGQGRLVLNLQNRGGESSGVMTLRVNFIGKDNRIRDRLAIRLEALKPLESRLVRQIFRLKSEELFTCAINLEKDRGADYS